MLVRALENAESDLCKTVPENHEGRCGLPSIPAYEPVHLTRSEIRAGYYKMVPVERVWEYESALNTKKWYAAGARPEDINDDKFYYIVPGSGTPTKRPVERTERWFIRDHAHFVRNAAINLAITRAHQRLRVRGLATNHVGFWLTDNGREAARLLTTPVDVFSAGAANRLLATPVPEIGTGAANNS
jgi:hypothetical protein